MKPELRIRPAEKPDVPSILKLIIELAEFEKLAHEVTATETVLSESLFGARPAAEALMIEVRDGVSGKWQNAGYAIFFTSFSTFAGKSGLYLEDVYVRPELRSHGIGREVLRHLAGIAVERGCVRFEWSVLDWNKRAWDFYRSLGAKPMEEWTVHRLSGAALENLAMEKTTTLKSWIAALAAGSLLALSGCSSSPKNEAKPPPGKPPVEILMVTPEIQETKAALEELLRKYDLTPYQFTNKVVIDAAAIPHSHPVLTLHTKERKDPDLLLATYIHEQLHWFLSEKHQETVNAIENFTRMYPKPPKGPGLVARDIDSTYLHLAVCWLELRALKKYLGPERALETLRKRDFYKWIYQTVVKDEDLIEAVMVEQGINTVTPPPPKKPQ